MTVAGALALDGPAEEFCAYRVRDSILNGRPARGSGNIGSNPAPASGGQNAHVSHDARE